MPMSNSSGSGIKFYWLSLAAQCVCHDIRRFHFIDLSIQNGNSGDGQNCPQRGGRAEKRLLSTEIRKCAEDIQPFLTAPGSSEFRREHLLVQFVDGRINGVAGQEAYFFEGHFKLRPAFQNLGTDQ